MVTFGAVTLIPGLPPSFHVPAPNRRVAAATPALIVVAHPLLICDAAKPLASTTPPVDGSAAIALLICAHGSAPGNAAAFSVPFTLFAVSVVKVPTFGVTLPIAGGDARSPPLPPPLPQPVHVPVTVRLFTVALRDESMTVLPETCRPCTTLNPLAAVNVASVVPLVG